MKRLKIPVLVIMLISSIGVLSACTADTDGTSTATSSSQAVTATGINTTTGLQDKLTDETSLDVSKVTTTQGNVLVEVDNVDFTKDDGAQNTDDLAHALAIARKSSLAKKGIVIVQTGSYVDEKGQKYRHMEFALHYTTTALKKISWEDFRETTLYYHPEYLWLNAKDYYIYDAFAASIEKTDKSFFRDFPSSMAEVKGSEFIKKINKIVLK